MSAFERWYDEQGVSFATAATEGDSELLLRDFGRLIWTAATEAKQVEIERRDDLLNYAWTIIANAYGGNWENAPMDWQRAAEKWRDQYHAALSESQPQEEKDG